MVRFSFIGTVGANSLGSVFPAPEDYRPVGLGLGVATVSATGKVRCFGSRFIAAVAATMNWLQMGAACVEPNTSDFPFAVFNALPSVVPSQTATANARV